MRGLSTYLGFRAAALAGTQTYLAAVVALPMLGIAFEYAIAWLGLGPRPAPNVFDLLGGALIVGGGIAVVWSRGRAVSGRARHGRR